MGHILVIVVAAAFVALGLWQLARHHQKQDAVRAAAAAYAAPAPELGAATPASGTRVQVTGAYDGAHEVLLRDQARGDDLGEDVLTPLRLGDGTAVLVDRGWVPGSLQSGPPNVAPPRPGPVVVRGIVREPRTLSSPDAARAVGNRLSVSRVDVARIGAGLPYRLRPLWIEARSQQPAPSAGAPALPQPPPPDHVNHMQYTIEWFALALIPLIGWPIVLLRRRSKRGEQSTTAP